MLTSPNWFLAALNAPAMYAIESGEHGMYTIRSEATGRYLTDADIASDVIVGGCLADGSPGPEFADVAAALVWVATNDGTPRDEWAE